MASAADMPAGTTANDPADDVARRRRVERLQNAIVALSPARREAFVLVYLEGLSAAEAARLLGTREGALWKRLCEARAHLRSKLEGEDP